MLRKNLLYTAVWAAGSFSLALALGLPLTLNAVDHPDSSTLVETIANPKIVVNGIEFSVVSNQPATQPSQVYSATAGKPFKFAIKAINNTRAPANADFIVRMTSETVMNPLSRRLPTPTEIWKQDNTITLNPGQSQTLSFTTVSLPENQMIQLILGSGGSQVFALSFAPSSPINLPLYAGVVPTTQPVLNP